MTSALRSARQLPAARVNRLPASVDAAEGDSFDRRAIPVFSLSIAAEACHPTARGYRVAFPKTQQ